MIYIITDPHFNHLEAMKKYCGRPDNYQELIKKSLMSLTEEDVLICLGDICIGNDEQVHEDYIKPLKCKKWLVKGNHDKKTDHWYLNHGWDMVCKQFKGKYFGKNVVFSHSPIVWDGIYDVNLHGHFHNTDHRRFESDFLGIRNGYQKLLALENVGYRAVSLKSLLEVK